ncbi:hypothetical protein BDP27DRAFT_1313405 [Rhodocollybia butyracea]|uniref:HIT-type domain-containing protein n=1 Tax=Rhodocollybia butyracea TaxID=206335 RepID=A0A9P5Q6R0_9AGAR|nr:hypothetical protein BDP27DRAFT_1313405 [Rhodocollybia butyracea]
MTDILSVSYSVPASRVLCSVCNARYAIYTCPRCKLRTCSLPCSSSHKITTNCSGERDKAAFVTMRDYSWGTLMSDYTYLEEVGRKVGEWGEVIGKGSYATNQLGRGSARGMRGGRGGNFRGRGGGNSSHPKTKRDILKAQLEMYDISMDLLPVGMERRQYNQSMWDFKNQTALLTIEFKFHPPRDASGSNSKQASSFSLITHRNNLNMSLLSLIAIQIRDRRNLELKRSKGKQKADAKDQVPNSFFPIWLLELVEEISDAASSYSTEAHSPFDTLIRAPVSPISIPITGTRPKAVYNRIIPTQSLRNALRNTHFVEFPSLEIWPRGEFSGVVADQHAESQVQMERRNSGVGIGRAVPQMLVYEKGDLAPDDYHSGQDAQRRAKRRKVELKAGQKAISGLLGGYGSGSDEEVLSVQEETKEKDKDGLALLGGYAESDDEEVELADSDEEEQVELSPEALLELMKNTHGDKDWMDDSNQDERMDWGDKYSEEDEEEENVL